MCVSTLRGQKVVLDPPQLELQVVVSHTAWVLGSEHGSSINTT